MVSVIEFLDFHGMSAFRTANGIISKGKDNSISLSGKRQICLSLFGRNGSSDSFVRSPVPCIDTVVTNHFKVFLRNMSHAVIMHYFQEKRNPPAPA